MMYGSKMGKTSMKMAKKPKMASKPKAKKVKKAKKAKSGYGM